MAACGKAAIVMPAFFVTGPGTIHQATSAQRFGSDGTPAPGQTTSGSASPGLSWTSPNLLALILVAWLILEPLSTSAGEYPTREYLIGDWFFHQTELGANVLMFWSINADGSTSYEFLVDGEEARAQSHWQYSDGIFNEAGPDYNGKAIFEKISRDKFVETIIYNGHPKFKGVRRVFSRIRCENDELAAGASQMHENERSWYNKHLRDRKAKACAAAKGGER